MLFDGTAPTREEFLIGDYDAMPDLEDLAAMFEDAIVELREAAADLSPTGRLPG